MHQCPRGLRGVDAVRIATPRKRGVGAVRHVLFEDGRSIEEHVTSWEAGRAFTYAATEGLPLRAYIATIVISDAKPDGGVRITWQSYMNSTKMTDARFESFLSDMAEFYTRSLANIRDLLHERGR